MSSLIAGIIVGALFTMFNFAPPVATTLPGILGIIGLYLGYIVVTWVSGWRVF